VRVHGVLGTSVDYLQKASHSERMSTLVPPSPTFIVASDADDIDDWTAATLFVAVREQLAALGIIAQWRPDGGPSGLYDCPDEGLASKVNDLFDRIVVGGTSDVVVLHGAIRTLGELRPAMDADLLQAIEGAHDLISPQRLLALYLVAHRERYGAELQVY
jgi:hypothetical protein